MVVYDFDKTIYAGDSTIDFYLFCVKAKPLILMRLPIQLLFMFLYKLGIIRKKRFKEIFFSFLKNFNTIDVVVDKFWSKNENKICSWYKEQSETSDLIISASPYFLLEPIIKKLKIDNLIATVMNKNTGIIMGENCYGEEKVVRYKEKYGNRKIIKFYSDSKSDLPIARLASRSYLVNLKSNNIIGEFD